jgi:hypothetical protein
VRRPQTLIAATLLALSWPAAAATPPVVAVFELRDAQGRLTPEERSQITRYFRVKLTERGAFPVVPEAELKRAIADQQAESYKECYDEACQIEIGREVAAQKSLALELVSVGARCILTATFFDLIKATSERAASVDAACEASALAVAASELADQLGPAASFAPRSDLRLAPPVAAQAPSVERVRVRVQTTDQDRQFEVSLFDADGSERRCSPALRAADVCHLGSGRVGRAQVTVRVPELGVAQTTLPFDETHTQAVLEVGVGRSWWAYGAWWMGASMGVGGLISLGLGAGGVATTSSRTDGNSFLMVTGTVFSLVGAALFSTGFLLPRPIDIDEQLLETSGT